MCVAMMQISGSSRSCLLNEQTTGFQLQSGGNCGSTCNDTDMNIPVFKVQSAYYELFYYFLQ